MALGHGAGISGVAPGHGGGISGMAPGHGAGVSGVALMNGAGISGGRLKHGGTISGGRRRERSYRSWTNAPGDGGAEMQWKLRGVSDALDLRRDFKINLSFESDLTFSFSSNLRQLFLTF